jgi:hypothetical protein
MIIIAMTKNIALIPFSEISIFHHQQTKEESDISYIGKGNSFYSNKYYTEIRKEINKTISYKNQKFVVKEENGNQFDIEGNPFDFKLPQQIEGVKKIIDLSEESFDSNRCHYGGLKTLCISMAKSKF